MPTLEQLQQLEAKGVIRPETRIDAQADWQETEDPATGDVTLRLTNPLPEAMTPAQATAAEQAGRISPGRAQAIRAGKQYVAPPSLGRQELLRQAGASDPQRGIFPTTRPGETSAATQAPPQQGAMTVGALPERVALPGGGSLRRGRQRQREMEAAYDAQAAAIEQRAAIDAQRAARRNEFTEGHLAEQARMQEREQAAEQTRQEALSEMHKQLQEAEENARYRIPPEARAEHQSVLESQFTTEAQKNRARLALQQAQKVDPMEAFPGVHNKILATVAMGLGGALSGLRGGPNHAANMIQNHINQSVRMQQAAFDRNRKALAAKRGGYADMRTRFADERSAELATRNRMLDDAKRYVDSIALSHGDAEAKARAAELAATIEQKKVANVSEMEQRHAALATQRFMQAEQVRGARAAMAAKSLQAQAKAQAQASQAPFALPGWVPSGDVPINPKFEKEMRAMHAAHTQGKAAIQRALELREGWHGLPFGAKKAAADVLRSELIMIQKNLDQAGALGEGEREFYQDLIGDIGSIKPWQTDRLMSVAERLDRAAAATMGSFGLKPDPAQARAEQQAQDPDAGMTTFARDVPLGEEAEEAG